MIWPGELPGDRLLGDIMGIMPGSAESLPPVEPPAMPDLRAAPGRQRFCWPWGPTAGWDVETVFREYGVPRGGAGKP